MCTNKKEFEYIIFSFKYTPIAFVNVKLPEVCPFKFVDLQRIVFRVFFKVG